MTFDRLARRRLTSRVVSGLALACVLAALLPLAAILFSSVVRGLSAFSIDFFTKPLPPPCGLNQVCTPGGVANAIEGTLIILGLAILIAIPLGLLCGICMAEYPELRIGRVVRFLVEILVGVPSIVIGVFIFSVFLLASQNGWFSADYVLSPVSCGAAIGLIMIPIIARSADEALRYVPSSLREASLALGVRKYQTTTRVVLPTAAPAVVTGILLATARGAGETAPLLILSGLSFFFFSGFNHPISALPYIIFELGQSPYANWVALAWGSTLVLVALMLALSIAVRVAVGGLRFSSHSGGS